MHFDAFRGEMDGIASFLAPVPPRRGLPEPAVAPGSGGGARRKWAGDLGAPGGAAGRQWGGRRGVALQ